jgi:hypothetical protein
METKPNPLHIMPGSGRIFLRPTHSTITTNNPNLVQETPILRRRRAHQDTLRNSHKRIRREIQALLLPGADVRKVLEFQNRSDWFARAIEQAKQSTAGTDPPKLDDEAASVVPAPDAFPTTADLHTEEDAHMHALQATVRGLCLAFNPLILFILCINQSTPVRTLTDDEQHNITHLGDMTMTVQFFSLAQARGFLLLIMSLTPSLHTFISFHSPHHLC